MLRIDSLEGAIAIVVSGGNPANLQPHILCGILQGRYFHEMKKATFPLQPAVFIERVIVGILNINDELEKKRVGIAASMLLELKNHVIADNSNLAPVMIRLSKAAGVSYKNAATDDRRRRL